MDIGKIITLDDNKDYLLLEKPILDNKEYLYLVEVDKEDMPTTNYMFVELIHEADGDYTEEVEDEKVVKALTDLLSTKYNNKSDEQAA